MRLFKRKAEPTETRATYTDMRVADAEAQVTGEGIDAGQLAAVQAAAGLWARSFAVASVEPATAATGMLTAAILHDMGRSLVLQGEAVYLIEADRAGLRLMRCSVIGILVRRAGLAVQAHHKRADRNIR